MTQGGAYGSMLGESFRLDHAPALVTRALRKADIAVTQIKCDTCNHGMTEPIPREDSFLVQLLLRDCPDHELWLDGRTVRTKPFAAGHTSLYDLKRNPVAYLRSSFHGLFFYLPRRALNAIADEAGARRVDELDCDHGTCKDDRTIRHLGSSIVAAFETPSVVSRLFFDQITLAVGTHVACAYGGMRDTHRPARGALAPWQARRTKDILGANLDGSIPLGTLARECGLSVSHFCRAFRQSTGMPPHQWLMRRRIEAAKVMLRERRQSTLSEIALACGFADQSHFTRIFSRTVGMSPGAWRRCLE